MVLPTSDDLLQQVVDFANKWWVSPTIDGFFQQVKILPTSDGSLNKWWFSQQVMVLPLSHGYFQQVMVFFNKWSLLSTSDGFLQQVMFFSNK